MQEVLGARSLCHLDIKHPSRINNVFSASLSACELSCVVNIIVVPLCCFILNIMSSTISVFFSSMDDVGSSRKSISGSITTALAIPSLCASPLERVRAFLISLLKEAHEFKRLRRPLYCL